METNQKGVGFGTPEFYQAFAQPIINMGRRSNAIQTRYREVNVSTDLEALYTEFTGKDPWSYGYASTAHTTHYVEWLENIIKTRCLTIVEPDTTGVQQARTNSGAG